MQNAPLVPRSYEAPSKVLKNASALIFINKNHFPNRVHKVLVGKPEGKRPLGRQRRRWEDNIKMDLEEVGRGCGD